jgi:hypothetical protein
MGNPHNPARIGEKWNQERIDLQLEEIEHIKDFVVLSGGWAWHFISPRPHDELKVLHDHKDIDIFVPPDAFVYLIDKFKSRDLKHIATKYDDASGSFYRYAKYLESGKIIFDVFLEPVPYVQINGFNIIDPKTLLSLYGEKHTSSECVAVRAAKKLVEKNIDPIGHYDLLDLEVLKDDS